MRQGIVVLSIITLAGVSTAGAAGPEPKTDDEKTIYAIGVALSQSLAPLGLTPAELELVKAGFADGAASRTPKVDMKTYGPKITELSQARFAETAKGEKQKAEAFLEKAAAEKGAEKKPSGLIYTEIKAGDGKQPTATDKVKVQYTGKLRDGTVFDSSVQRAEPAELALHGIIPCWTEALQLMKEHGKAKFVCPAALAYGDLGAPPRIKPGAPLVFEVELLEVSPVSDDPHQGMMGHGMPPGHGDPGAADPAPAADGAGAGKAE